MIVLYLLSMFQSTVTAVSSSAGSLVAGHRVRSVLQVRRETGKYCQFWEKCLVISIGSFAFIMYD